MTASTNSNPRIKRPEPKLPKYPAVTVTLRISPDQLQEMVETLAPLGEAILVSAKGKSKLQDLFGRKAKP